jgi:hypothetical protein
MNTQSLSDGVTLSKSIDLGDRIYASLLFEPQRQVIPSLETQEETDCGHRLNRVCPSVTSFHTAAVVQVNQGVLLYSSSAEERESVPEYCQTRTQDSSMDGFCIFQKA